MNQIEDGWVEMTYKEIDEIWERFFERFDFNPNVDEFPTIDEPTPSVTYSLLNETEIKPTIIDEIILNALRRHTKPASRVAWLDWQHICFWLHPHQATSFDVITNSLPWGDYSIFVEPKFDFGIYGEPHEQTLCVFGAELVKNISIELDPILNRVREKNVG